VSLSLLTCNNENSCLTHTKLIQNLKEVSSYEICKINNSHKKWIFIFKYFLRRYVLMKQQDYIVTFDLRTHNYTFAFTVVSLLIFSLKSFGYYIEYSSTFKTSTLLGM